MRPSVDTSQSTRTAALRPNSSTALASCHSAFFATGLISAMSNVLMLTGAVFMLQVYDRVLPSRSVPTLIGLAILAVGLYAALRAARSDSRAHPHSHRHQPAMKR